MKKLPILGLAAAVAVLAMASTADARGRCGGRFFGGGGGCGHQSYYSGGCGHGGFYNAGYYQPVYMPSPTPMYYPSNNGGPSITPLPAAPKKLQMPSPDGASSIKTLQIYGQLHGQMPNGSYANIQNGDFARFTGKTPASDGYGGYYLK